MHKWNRRQSKKYISKVSVGFVKCCEWHKCPQTGVSTKASEVTLRVACRPHCLYDITTIPASVCVVSVIKVLLSCSHVSTASCDNLWHNTNAISIDTTIRRLCITTAGPSLSQRSSSPSTPSFTPELNYYGITIIDNWGKIDFKQTIIDFREKKILTSLYYSYITVPKSTQFPIV